MSNPALPPAPPPPPEPLPPVREGPRQPTELAGYAEPEGYHGPPVISTDRPHFVRMVEGEPDVCGQCGLLWPCPSTQAGAPDNPDGSAGRVYSGAVMPVELAAEAAGVPVQELQQRAAGLLADRLP